MAFFPFPPIPDPAYGTGVFRRRIRLEKQGCDVVAGLEDDRHACWLRLQHRHGRIAAIEAHWVRQPTMTCSGSTGQLSSLAGRPLTGSWLAFRDYEDPRLHCTHLHNLLGLAAAHALRDAPRRQFDVAVPDLRDGRTLAQVRVDGQLAHRWSSDLQTLIDPVSLGGISLFKGFTQRLAEQFRGDALEAAHVLHMGLFVAGSRMYDTAAMQRKYPDIPHVAAELGGTCYARQPERFDAGVPTVDHTRDFTEDPDAMLRFLPNKGT